MSSKVVNAMFQTSRSSFNPTGSPTPGAVPDKKKHLKRFAFLAVFDVSGSTGIGTNPDCPHISDGFAQIVETLRNPPPGSELALSRDSIDFAAITYSDKVTEILPWCTADNLPVSVAPFSPQGGTHTADALEYGLGMIGDRLRYYEDPANNITSGRPHILHVTDGAPTDMSVGSDRWNQLQTRLLNLNTVEKKRAAILHFVSPNGCSDAPDFKVRAHNGQEMTGQKVMAELSGAPSVFQLSSELGAFHALVEMVTQIISSISVNFGTRDAARRALNAADGLIKPTQNYV